jgi:hypothetical protein
MATDAICVLQRTVVVVVAVAVVVVVRACVGFGRRRQQGVLLPLGAEQAVGRLAKGA